MKKLQKIIATTVMTTLVASCLTPAIPSFAGVEDNKIFIKNEQQKRNVMYYSDWSIWGGQENFYPKDIPADQLTHLNLAFLDFDSEGNLVFTDKDAAVGAPVGQPGVQWGAANAGILNALQELRANNPNVKLGISIGGWSRSGDFTEVAKNPVKRAKFVSNIVKYVEYTNMDYVDVDWEYPNYVRAGDTVDLAKDEGTPNSIPEDKENYVLLLEELRAALDKKGAELGKVYELSLALPVGKEKIDGGIDVERIFNTIDFANIMTYDMRGAWEGLSGHHAGLYPNPNDTINTESGRLLSADQTVDYLISLGAEPDKILVGVAYYTRGWDKVDEGDNPDLPGLYQKAHKTNKDADSTPSYGAPNELPLKSGDGGRASGVWSYRKLNKLRDKYPGLKDYWDDVAKAPYLYDKSTGKFFTYDNVRSINEKADYVNENNLGGIIGWQASNDQLIDGTDVRGELTRATKKALFGQKSLIHHDIVYSELDISATVTPNEQQGGTKGYEITINNNEKAEENDAVLKELERGAETIKGPKLYIKTDKALTGANYLAGTVTYDNGYTVVDLKSVWEGKNIDQGQSYTFQLSGDSKIESIEIIQRMSDNSPDMGRQTIYGEEIPVENQAPVFSGVINKTIKIGETFNQMSGVNATDKEDGDLTSKINVIGQVDTNQEGEYTLTYSVTDSQDLKTTKTRIITVENVVTPNTAPTLTSVEAKTIKVGESFNKMSGVKAIDKEDGDLTSQIKVTGKVDTSKVGKYTLTYTVTDSKGLTTTKTRVITVESVVNPPDEGSDFGVGQGIEWPAQINAPFADMTAWNNGEFSVNGALNLKKIVEDTGVKFFNLGFIQSTSGISDGKVNWGWGGFSVLNEKNADNTQYQGIKQTIKDVRALGGDVIISLGGLNGQTFWEVTSDVDVLYNTYKEIVTGYGLTRLDLDIEGGPASNKDLNRANAKAIKRIQDETDLQIVLTLPVLPSGLTHTQLDILEMYLSEGVNIHLVNIMAMCYGPATLLPGENYGTASLRAVDSTKDQVKDYFKKYANIELTDAQAYRKIGTTVSVGFEGEAHPLFPKEWSKLVVDHAIDKGIGMTSMWSINRDSMAQSNKGIYAPYEHTNLFKSFGDVGIPNPNTAPTLTGVEDKTIIINEDFEALSSVEAHDKEDGNLTSKIKVTGNVDNTKSGKYTLTYTVTDSKGLTTTKTRTITVKDHSNTAPTLTGVEDKTININEDFEALADVKAHDEEDGNLTSKIKVTGNIDNTKAGKYTLTYTVTDSKGLTTTKTRTITVKDHSNTAPTLMGVEDKTININEDFEALAGVKAHDEEDGNLTSKIKVTGNVDNTKAGKYTLTYTVTDSKGLTTTKTRTIIVKDSSSEGTYDPNKIYLVGDVVTYKGEEYKAKWWTKGDAPDKNSSSVWEKIVKPNGDGSVDWYEGMISTNGDLVKYNGKVYEAKWWTTSIPGSDDSWKLIP